MPALTAELGQFVAGLTLRDIPAEAQAVAKTGITDCFGVMIAGAQDPVVALIDREMAGSDGSALASLIPSLKRRNVEDAALVNGAAAHVLDYDDVTLDGHPSAVLVPAIIAQGETFGASGSELLTAYVAGYEVWAELLMREPVPLHQKGWHPTAVRGAVAAARPDVVVHTAYRMHDASVNVEGTRAVAGAAVAAGARLVHLSSDIVFPGTDTRALTEDDEPRPVTPYGASKLEAERLCPPQVHQGGTGLVGPQQL